MNVEETGESELLDGSTLAEQWPDSDGCYWLSGVVKRGGPTFAVNTADDGVNCTG